MSRVFFYGLFMDVDMLRGMGLAAHPIARAELPDYRLRIGNRAGLVPDSNAVAYGMVIDMPDGDVEILYSAPDVAGYQPVSVEVTRLSDGGSQTVLCYNIPDSEIGCDTNSAYAKTLRELVTELGFPEAYANGICPDCDD